MRCIAHRGASGYAPENTRAAFDLAIAMGAHAIETDVSLSRDGALVLVHDDAVDRVTDGSGPVADQTLAELRFLDAGSWFDGRFAGERILTLGEAIEEYAGRIPFAIEIKDPLAAVPTMQWLSPCLGRTAVQIEVTSFSWSALLAAQAVTRDVRYGFLTPAWDSGLLHRCVARGFGQICPRVDVLTSDLVARAHEIGLDVRAWGVRERFDIDRLSATGADGATCNWPDWMALS